MGSAGVIASALNCVLVVVWEPDIHCEATFSQLFESNEILVTTSLSYPFPSSGSSNSNSDSGSPSEPSFPSHSGSGSSSSSLPFSSSFSSDDKDIYVSTACVIQSVYTDWGKESKWLQRNIIPVRSIQEEMDIQKCKFDFTNAIGVHIRMGQFTDPKHVWEDMTHYSPEMKQHMLEHRGRCHYSHFFIEMNRIWKVPGSAEQTFFVCADNDFIYTALQEYYKHDSRVYCIPRSVFDRSQSQIVSAIVDVWLLKGCKSLMGSSLSSFTELVTRLSPKPLRMVGKDFGTTKYALSFQPTSLNIGDDIQALAARAFLPQVNYLIHRDELSSGSPLYSPDTGLALPSETLGGGGGPNQNPTTTKIQYICNGWFDGKVLSKNFPPAKNIDALFVSFHLNESSIVVPSASSSESIHCGAPSPLFESDDGSPKEENIDYMREHGPIGCRDENTMFMLLLRYNIPAYHTMCLTLTLGKTDCSSSFPMKTENKRNDTIVVVDSNILERDLFTKWVRNPFEKLRNTFITE